MVGKLVVFHVVIRSNSFPPPHGFPHFDTHAQMWQPVLMNKVIRTVEISAELDAAVERLAHETARTPSEIVSAAVEQLLASSDDLALA